MTEITVNIRWTQLIIAIFLGPGIATTLLIVACMLFPPALFIAILFAAGSLCFGYVSYLILAGPLMILAQLFGFAHPLLHGLIGYGAVMLIPAAHAVGLPIMAEPDMVEMGQWFGPVWCALAAATYGFLCKEFEPLEEVKA